MKIQTCIVLAITLLAIGSVPIARFALADPPAISNPQSTSRPGSPASPAQGAYAHRIRLAVIAVTPIERIDTTQILKLDVERNYGKIDGTSLNRAKKHETQRFTILFPASLDADIRAGDLIDYTFERHTALGHE